MVLMDLRSVSFDTSFLLKPSSSIDIVVKYLSKDKISCFITATVVSELELLKIWGRISPSEFHLAIKRWKRLNAIVIDFKNKLLNNEFRRVCMVSMKKHHDVKADDIINDCNILITTLKKGINLFLSEDFHFTSKITRSVINEVINEACSEYHQMCNSNLYSINASTFLKAYRGGKVDTGIISKSMLSIRKPGKRL